ncbi:MAG: hypothetical protein IPP51_01190 [Bacteroidetes bacterium]|nr:hypothetical protein [Bacteroidota bacterium]
MGKSVWKGRTNNAIRESISGEMVVGRLLSFRQSYSKSYTRFNNSIHVCSEISQDTILAVLRPTPHMSTINSNSNTIKGSLLFHTTQFNVHEKDRLISRVSSLN